MPRLRINSSRLISLYRIEHLEAGAHICYEDIARETPKTYKFLSPSPGLPKILLKRHGCVDEMSSIFLTWFTTPQKAWKACINERKAVEASQQGSSYSNAATDLFLQRSRQAEECAIEALHSGDNTKLVRYVHTPLPDNAWEDV